MIIVSVAYIEILHECSFIIETFKLKRDTILGFLIQFIYLLQKIKKVNNT